IEQDNLFRNLDLKKSIDDKANAQVRATQIKTFLNPMDGIKQVTNDYGATNYLFSAGSKYDLKVNDGIFYLNSAIKFAQITDGTSNTMMAVESLKGDSGMKATDVHRQYVYLKK